MIIGAERSRPLPFVSPALSNVEDRLNVDRKDSSDHFAGIEQQLATNRRETVEALAEAFYVLGEVLGEELSRRILSFSTVVLCIFEEVEYEKYLEAISGVIWRGGLFAASMVRGAVDSSVVRHRELAMLLGDMELGAPVTTASSGDDTSEWGTCVQSSSAVLGGVVTLASSGVGTFEMGSVVDSLSDTTVPCCLPA